MENSCWRVKLYQLELGGIWNDQGTGFVSCEQITCDSSTETPSPSYAGCYLMVRREENSVVLLQSAIQYEDAYERQGESIIMWREKSDSGLNEIDYALSFENTAGCYAIWNAINDVQACPCKPSSAPTADGAEREEIGITCANEARGYPEENKKSDDWISANGAASQASNEAAAGLNDMEGFPGAGPSLLIQELASSYIGLPPVSAENLEEIKDKILSAYPSQKEVYASIIRDQDGKYLQQLFDLSEESARQAGDNCSVSCRTIGDIVRGVVQLNDPEILQLLLGTHHMCCRVAGALDRAPLKGSRCTFKEQLMRNPTGPPCIVGINFGSDGGSIGAGSGSALWLTKGSAADLVTRLFRARLLQDYMGLPLGASLQDDGGALSSLLSELQASLCDLLFRDTSYLRKVLHLLEISEGDSGIGKRKDWLLEVEADYDDEEEEPKGGEMGQLRTGLGFLRELFFMSRQLGLEQRSELYANCLEVLREPFFSALRNALCLRDEKVCMETSLLRVMAAEILSSVTTVCPCFLRKAIIEGPVPSPPPYCSTSKSPSGHSSAVGHPNDSSFLFVIIERLCCDPEAAVTEHLGETLKVLLDQERLDAKESDRFLALFYDYYIHWLLVPFALDSVTPDQPCNILSHPTSGNEFVSPHNFSAVSSSRRFLCEIFSQCTESHSYRMKFFIFRNNVIPRVLRLLKSRHRHLHIGAVKFIRAVLAVKDDFYHRHIVKYDLLHPLLELFQCVYMKDTLITSAIVELIDYIRSERVVTLVIYLVEKYRHVFDLCLGQEEEEGGQLRRRLLHVEVFQKFMHTYEQLSDQETYPGSISSQFFPDPSAHATVTEKSGDAGRGVTRNRINKTLAEIESEEAYFLDVDNDDEYMKGALEVSAVGSVGNCPQRLQSSPPSNDKTSYFDLNGKATGMVHGSATSGGKGNKDSGCSNSLLLISDTYGEDDDVDFGRSSEVVPDNSCAVGSNILRGCCSPPPDLPPLKSKFEQDGDEEGVFFQSSKIISRERGRGASRASTPRDTGCSLSLEASSGRGGGVKFSMKKKQRFF